MNTPTPEQTPEQLAASCFMCRQAGREGCLECRTSRLIADIRTSLYERMGTEQNQSEWEERANKAEASREHLERQMASLIVERDNALERREKAETALKAMAEPISKQKQTHTHDLGVNSDPDHCLDCCDEKYEGACEIARKWAHQAGENRERAEKSEAKLRIAEKAFENQLGPCQFSDVSAGEGYTYQAHINGIRDRMMAVAEQALKDIREGA